MAKTYANLADYIEQWSIPEPNTGCWLWLGAAFPNGYGSGHWDGKTQKANRLAFRAFKGNVPDGMLVCHKCDVRACVNPDHLWLGNHRQNMADMKGKGRQAQGALHSRLLRIVVAGKARRGEQHYKAKLTADDVRKIRLDTRPQSAIAADYGVTRSLISVVKARKKWAHVS